MSARGVMEGVIPAVGGVELFAICSRILLAFGGNSCAISLVLNRAERQLRFNPKNSKR
jgi:hypothetical protein